MHLFINREMFPLITGFLLAHYKKLSIIPAYRYSKITHHQVNGKALHNCFCNSGLKSLQQHKSEGLNEKESMLNTGKYCMQILIIHDWVTKKYVFKICHDLNI